MIRYEKLGVVQLADQIDTSVAKVQINRDFRVAVQECRQVRRHAQDVALKANAPRVN